MRCVLLQTRVHVTHSVFPVLVAPARVPRLEATLGVESKFIPGVPKSLFLEGRRVEDYQRVSVSVSLLLLSLFLDVWPRSLSSCFSDPSPLLFLLGPPCEGST